MSAPLNFPDFSPTVFSLGPFTVGGVTLGPFGIRWYALAYITALLIGWRLTRRLARLSPVVATPMQVDDFLTWATIGVVVGGRLGYTLFYQPGTFLAEPWRIPAVWEGGMSFHGGMLGVTAAIILFCRRAEIPILGFADRIAIVAPIGLGLGRVANFINGELWGRVAPDWWPGRMIFPNAPRPDAPDFLARYPSQLYEALLEGLVLFLVLWALSRSPARRARFGALTGWFLAGYAVARMVGEFFRAPDWFLGFILPGVSMGQILSLPMLLAGLWLIARARPTLLPSVTPAPAR